MTHEKRTLPRKTPGDIYGDVMVSTGILKLVKRVESQKLFKTANLKLNANEKVALAA